ncbi:MAG: hypothetical protein LBD03_00080 [Methanobrevibacter sp.]|jgi:hypothetical protein|nr:hypothetical protein [Candidatus Methanovirga procula]
MVIKLLFIHLFNAAASQNSINQVNDLSVDAPSEGTIRYRLRKPRFGSNSTEFE